METDCQFSRPERRCGPAVEMHMHIYDLGIYAPTTKKSETWYICEEHVPYTRVDDSRRFMGRPPWMGHLVLPFINPFIATPEQIICVEVVCHAFAMLGA